MNILKWTLIIIAMAWRSTSIAAATVSGKDEHYAVRIVRTVCNLGGSRAWFICPAVGCGRRVAILYGGGIFACRHC